ncbi:MAG: RNA pseudouridine synthase, partial [Myxococcota bacterium]
QKPPRRPETGRTHQLRVHLQHVGSPIFGDPHYGGPRRIVRDNGAVVTARRVMLHCREVQIGDGPPIEAPLPEDFVAAWARLAG